jgi:hypothetical protein
MKSLVIKVFTHPETVLTPSLFTRDYLLPLLIDLIPNRFLVLTLLMVISVPVTG